MSDHIRFFASTLVVLGIIGCSSDTSETQATKEPISEEKVVAAGDATKGKSLFITCAVCHGQNGEGMAALNAPALAGQEAYYLKQQLDNFRTNKRGVHADDTFGAQMAPMAKTLNSEGIDDVIAYIRTQPLPKVENTIAGNIENGKNYYNMICGACHGPGANGTESLFSPRLIGMQDWYLERQINNFRNGVRGKEEGDAYGAQMQQIAASIPDDQTVKDLVAYLNSLNAE